MLGIQSLRAEQPSGEKDKTLKGSMPGGDQNSLCKATAQS